MPHWLFQDVGVPMEIEPRYKLWLLSEIYRIAQKRPFMEHIDVGVEKTHPIFKALEELADLGYARREYHETRLKTPWGTEYVKGWYSWSVTDEGKRLLSLPEKEALLEMKIVQGSKK